jgi:tetratricopeptide (TPR) repeat protein
MCRLAAEQLAAVLPGEAAGDQPVFSSPAHVRGLVKILIWLGAFNRHLRQLEDAQLALRQAQAWLDNPIFVEQDTRSEQAHLLLERAEVVATVNNEEARHCVEQSLALYCTLEDQWCIAQGLELLGEAVQYLGQLDQARRVHEKSLTLRQALGDPRGIARSFQRLGAVARYQGQFEEAEQLLRKSISLFREIGDPGQLAFGLHWLGVNVVHGGKFADSLLWFKECLAIYNNLGLPHEPGMVTGVLGFALIHLGRYEEAQHYLQKGLKLYPKLGERGGLGYGLKNLGRVALAEERYSEAQHLLQESLTVFRNMEEMHGMGQALGILGYVALRLDNRDQAQHYIHENLQIAVATKMFLPRMTALTGMALLLADQDDKERAIEIYTLALQNPHVANSRWFEDVAGRHITAIAKLLPQEVVTAAQDRGKARDMWATAAELLAELKRG